VYINSALKVESRSKKIHYVEAGTDVDNSRTVDDATVLLKINDNERSLSDISDVSKSSSIHSENGVVFFEGAN
jgi:hypothetical protein